MTLYEALSEVKDPRRAEGKRFSLEQIFTMIILANLCGHFGGRGVARFSSTHSASLTTELDLKHKPPSHVTFSDLLNRCDESQLINAFNKWAGFYVPLKEGDMVSGDGKSLRSTLSDAFENGQDFKAVVSLFCQESGLVYALEQYRNAKKSEIDVVRFLIEKLDQMGITLFLDALHCQKKLPARL